MLLSTSASGATPAATTGQTTIRVDAGQVANRINKWMYGSCIEDVNHEIYGGLYAQKIFGESFEEPPVSPPPLRDWRAYGGRWRVTDGATMVEAEAGAKMVRDAPEMRDGSVECEVRFADDKGENAGLILRVQNPRIGADAWIGYEISLNIRDKTLLLGRHRNDWQLLRTVPMPVVTGRWYRLRVEMVGATLSITVDGNANPALEYTDRADIAILNGRVGLRTWNSNAAFRRLRIETTGGQVSDNLDQPGPHKEIPVSGMWDALHTGTATARYIWDTENPFNTAHSQRLERGAGTGVVGITNRGLNRWGIAVRRGQQYAGRLYLRGQDYRGRVMVALQSADGARTYARQRLAVRQAAWTQRDFILRPNATDPNARFAIWIDQPGSVWLDQIFLSGTGRDLFRGVPVRADIAGKMVEQGLTFLRYGGTMVNAPEYRWKKMIGPPDRRPQYRGHWYPYSTNGFGIEDFVKFCEAAGFEPSFAINVEETPQDMADMVEYLNGPVTTPWGRRRAENGHPKPYNVRYIEIGNEEVIWGDNAADYDHYVERFKILSTAMRRRDTNLQFICAAWWRPESRNMERVFKALNGLAAYWDLHPWADDARSGRSVDQQLTQMRSLFQQWVPGTTMKCAIFEENGSLHNMQRALGHATVLNAAFRHGDFVLTSCPANALQPWQQNDNGWDQGQIFFTPDQVWGMPPFYAQQMASRNYLPLRVQSVVDGNDDLDVTATRSEDGKTLVLNIVNTGGQPQKAALALSSFGGVQNRAQVWTLTGDLQAVNSPKDPEHIRWQQSVIAGIGTRFTYTLPAYSYTVLRLHR